MKKKLFGIVDLKPSLKCEQSVLLEYYISEMEEEDENFNAKKPFGIEVVKKQTIDGVVYKEIKSVSSISISADYIKNILDILKRNNVTPLTVSEILEDLAVRV